MGNSAPKQVGMRARYKGVQTTKGTTRGRSGAGQQDGQQDDEASLVGLVHIARVVVELPYTLFQTIIYGIITYSAMGFHWYGYKFFWYLFVTLYTLLCYTYCGMMTVAISPNSQVAAIIASAFYNIFNLFSGFLIPRPQFPGWWLWYYWICPLSWTLNGLMTSQYGDLRKKISVEGKPQQAIEDFLKDYFGFQRDFLDVVAAVLAIFPVLFALSFCISINILNFQKR